MRKKSTSGGEVQTRYTFVGGCTRRICTEFVMSRLLAKIRLTPLSRSERLSWKRLLNTCYRWFHLTNVSTMEHFLFPLSMLVAVSVRKRSNCWHWKCLNFYLLGGPEWKMQQLGDWKLAGLIENSQKYWCDKTCEYWYLVFWKYMFAERN